VNRRRAPTSRQRYREFVDAYRRRALADPQQSETTGERGADAPTPPVSDTPPRSWRARVLQRIVRGDQRAYLRSYLAWLAPHRSRLVAVAALAMASAGLEMIEPLFLRFIVDNVLLKDSVARSDKFFLLNAAGGLFLLVVVASALVDVLRDYTQRVLNYKVMLSLRRALFDRLLHLPLPKLWDMKTGGILSRLSGDVDTTTGLMQMAIISPSISVLRLFIAIGVLFSLNWRLAVTALSVIPGAMLMSFIFARRIRPIYRVIRHDAEQIDGRVGEAFSGIRVVRAFRQEASELLAYMQGRHTVLRKELFAHRRELVLWTSWGLLIAGVNVIIIWFGGYLNIEGRASVGDIMAFQWYTFLLMNPVWNIVNSFSEMQRALAAMERVFALLALDPDKPDRPAAIAAPHPVEEIAFENVSFGYRENSPVVHDLDVRVPAGTVVALVGRSGAGKTTITDLVARFHDPTHGRITLNGVDLRDLRLGSYRANLALVQQEVFLFDGSVRENIAYGRLDASDAEIESAARRANAHDFIELLVQGYDTVIGERGVKLSGGQKQRLAIARAILADPPILILDEATSNLDTESEQLIQASLTELVNGRTTFMIAHRLSTIRRADLILVLEQGRVMERGTHDTLMARGGLYAEMVERQSTQMID
jgi:ATP-binding cassette subfamily B protein/subfamily B ATP-binding cassette protein MsbA